MGGKEIMTEEKYDLVEKHIAGERKV